MKKINRKGIIALIILLSIGFAAVSTSLVINGTGLFGVNVSDFDVYFSSAIIDGVENNEVISADGKSITYETKELAFIGDTSVLDFKVTNNSKQYDASVSIECVVSGEKANDYYKVEKELPEKIEASSEEAGKITVTLNKTSVENLEETFTCTIKATAIEREEEANFEETTTYSLGGYLLDENGEVQANKTAVVFSETPHIVTSDLDGYIYVEGLERGSHEIYYMGSMSEEELSQMSKDEIKEAAISEGYTTTSSNKVEMSNNYKLKSFAIGDTEELKVVELKIGEEVYKQIAKEESMDITIPEENNYSLIMCSNNTVPSISGSKVSLNKITSEVECGFYSDINTAVTESNTNGNNNYIVVLKDITSNKRINIKSNLSMDINGHNLIGSGIEYSFINVPAANVLVNIKDSMGTGKIINEDQDGITIDKPNCEVYSSVNVEASRSAYRIYSGGTNSIMNINGGNINCTGSNSASGCIYTSTGDLTIEDATITSNSPVYVAHNSTININNNHASTVNNMNAVMINATGVINIEQSKISAVNGTGIYNFGTVNIENSFIKSEGYFAIVNDTDGLLNINGAYAVLENGEDYVSGTYIYSSSLDTAAIQNMGNNSITNINGGTIFHDYDSSGTWRQIAVRSEGGTININDGVIYALGYIENQTYSDSFRSLYLNQNSIANIRNGEIKGNVFVNYNTANDSGNPINILNICGGKISGKLEVGLENDENFTSKSYIYYKSSGIEWANETGGILIVESSIPYILQNDSITCK